MLEGQRKYNEEFKNIIELYNSGKNPSESNSKYDITKSTISGWLKKLTLTLQTLYYRQIWRWLGSDRI